MELLRTPNLAGHLAGNELNDDTLEQQMPTHIVWGEVDSGGSLKDSTELDFNSGNQTSSDQGSVSSRKKKIKNKCLERRPQRLVPESVEFRDLSEQSAQSIDSAGSAEGENEFVREGPQNQMQHQQEEALVEQQRRQQAQAAPQVNPEDLSPEEFDALLKQVPVNEKGAPTSLGSVSHPESCKPCLFVHTHIKCHNGLLCTFCHFEHKRRSKPRPCKGKRERYRKLLGRLADTDAPEQGEQGEQGEQAPQNPVQMQAPQNPVQMHMPQNLVRMQAPQNLMQMQAPQNPGQMSQASAQMAMANLRQQGAAAVHRAAAPA